MYIYVHIYDACMHCADMQEAHVCIYVCMYVRVMCMHSFV